MDLKIPEQIDQILSKLRAAIRRYVVLRGVALVFTVVAILFWITLGIDNVWFGLTRLEIPRSVRLAILLISLSVIVLVFYQTLIRQMLVKLRRRALALLLERTFPELNDRLITVVELGEKEIAQPANRGALSNKMVQKTIDDAGRLVDSLETSRVFNFGPLRTAIVLASIAVVSLVATAAASPGTMSHWSKAYLKLAEEYWDRKNGLEIVSITQPGDRVREFQKRNLKHAAGTDLTIIARVQEGKTAPDQVMISYRTKTDARGKAVMAPAGQGQFRYTIGNLVDDLQFTITGGDFTTVEPYTITTVPEPSIISMLANCTFPEYTGWNQSGLGDEREQVIGAAELNVPMETTLVLQAESTSPLRIVRILGRRFELTIEKKSVNEEPVAICRYLDDLGVARREVKLTQKFSGPLISEDGRKLAIPALITQVESTIQTCFDKVAESSYDDGIVIDREDQLSILLEDVDQIVNLKPIRIHLRGVADESPEVTTRLVGIGRAITRKAFLPVEGELQDDYGLISAAFQYRLEQQPEPVKLPLKNQPGGTQFYEISQQDDATSERFDVLPMDLEVGNILYLNLAVTDNDTINGPHTTLSETFRLKVVTDEELLSILHQDELNLRRRFEQLIEELTRSRDDFASALTENADDSTDDSLPVGDAVQRSLNTLRKDSVEADAIRVAFESIQLEMVNNRIDTPQVRVRLQSKIIDPLSELLKNEFATTEEHFRLLDFALREDNKTEITPDLCLNDIDGLLSGLRQILLEMRKLESFQEVIELLKGIIEEEKALKAQTEEERKNKLIDLLN
ncbi:MAG: hypothetical protein CMN21_13125 [Rubinisphaera sp.]|uniref:hypothetical protein n=1 Tax=Rubinisphaera sp. TaxID=2024857 RepID=UPI000C0F0AFF|nr:hypothetical protein [Rubinisphaera sp.]MBV10147.1 hypothetical protein [Rubinisphaera sp.]